MFIIIVIQMLILIAAGAILLDLIKNEEEVLSYWKSNKIMDKIRSKNKGKKSFYFLDGPPFVSGDLHPGQMWVKTMKDVILRYRRLRGFDVYDRAGYDVHGLPIEKKVEANLGIGSKKEIEAKIGIEKFIESCKEYVSAYIGRMDADYERFGISLDFSDPYLPYKNSYIEMDWWFLKQMWEKGLVYNDKRATLYCPNCGTAVSQGGMEINYVEDEDPSVHVLFRVNTKLSKPKIDIDDNTFLLIWTTTPWTLPANVAAAANPKELYVKARVGDKSLIVAKGRLDEVVKAMGESAVVQSEFYGSELEGIYYINPLEGKLEEQKKLRKYHRVLMSEELVSSSEGTGLVHIAPGHGFEDYLLGKKNHIPIFSPVNEQALYTQDAGAYAGLRVPAEANKKVAEDLKRLGVLVSESSIKHSYPHCWRCDEKLIFIATNQWFVNIQKVKKKMIEENSKVNWHPQEAKKWQEDVLRSSPDWCVSRQRYWGAPMPIWRCENGDIRLVGSFGELKELAIDKKAAESVKDLHRPYIDAIHIRCEKCGKEMKRIPDILDVWFDSSIAFRASLSEEQFAKLFPMDFILEAVEQLRAWFSYQFKSSTIVYGKKPFKNVVTHGMLLGSDGREMHKKLGNYVPLNDLLQKSTADAFRLWCTAHTPQYDLLFSEERIRDSDKVVALVYNIGNLLKDYTSAIGYAPKKVRAPSSLEKLKHEDAWIVSRLNTLVKSSTEQLDDYEISKYVTAAKEFVISDFSRIYLKVAKKRILYGNRRDARQAVDIVNYVFYNLLVLLSPVMPFATEKQYLSNYGNERSVSLLDWPKYKEKLISKQLEEEFEIAVETITALLNAREKTNVKLRWPLSQASVEVNEDKTQTVLERLSGLVEDYTNIKRVSVKRVVSFGREVRPIFAKIGPNFKEKAGAVAEALKKEDADKLETAITSNGHYSLHTGKGLVDVTADHFTIVQKPESENAVVFKHGIASVDKEISRELWEEGMVREFERRVQLARKEKQLKKTDKIKIFYEASAPFAEVVKKNAEKIKKDVNAKQLHDTLREGSTAQEIEVEEEKLSIEIEKIE